MSYTKGQLHSNSSSTVWLRLPILDHVTLSEESVFLFLSKNNTFAAAPPPQPPGP